MIESAIPKMLELVVEYMDKNMTNEKFVEKMKDIILELDVVIEKREWKEMKPSSNWLYQGFSGLTFSGLTEDDSEPQITDRPYSARQLDQLLEPDSDQQEDERRGI